MFLKLLAIILFPVNRFFDDSLEKKNLKRRQKSADYLTDLANLSEFDDLFLDYIATVRSKLSGVLSILHKCWLYVKHHPKPIQGYQL